MDHLTALGIEVPERAEAPYDNTYLVKLSDGDVVVIAKDISPYCLLHVRNLGELHEKIMVGLGCVYGQCKVFTVHSPWKLD